MEQVWDAFHKKHKKEYGHNFLSADIEMVSVKLKGQIKKENSRDEFSFNTNIDEIVSRLTRPCTKVEFSIDGKPQSFETELIDRKTLAGGAQITGPNVIYQEDSTTIVPPGWTMTVDDDLTLRLKKMDNNNG